MSSSARRSFNSLALLVALVALVTIAACGRRVSTTETQSSAATNSASATPAPELIALLSSYEGGPPDRAQIEAASSSPTADLLVLASDSDQPGSVRFGAVRALGSVGSSQALDHLKGLLAEATDAQVVRAAIQGVSAHLDQPELVSLVTHHLQSPEPRVARAAVLALANDAASRPALEALAEQELAPAVRSALDEALARTNESPPVPTATPTSSKGRGERR